MFWSYVITLSLTLAALVLGLAVPWARHSPTLRVHVVYLGCYAAWLLCSAYLFVQALYPSLSGPDLYFAFNAARLFAALFLLYVGAVSALRFAGIQIRARQWWLLLIPVAFVSGAVFAFYATGSPRVALVANGFFNAYLALLFFVAAFRTGMPGTRASVERATGSENRSPEAFVPYLWASGAGYVTLLALNALTAAGLSWIPTAPFFAGSAAFFCLLWSSLTILGLCRLRRAAAGSSLPSKAEDATGDVRDHEVPGVTPEYPLRRAVEGDQERIRRLVRQARINPFGLSWPNFIVADSPTRGIVACGQLKPHGRGIVELASLVVEPDFRGRGIARAVVERLLDQAPRPLYLMCLPHLTRFYARFGFASVDLETLPLHFRRIERLSRLLRLFNRARAPVLMCLHNVDTKTTRTQNE